MLMVMLSSSAASNAQDVHIAQIQEMNTWYNPALKTNKVSQTHISFRSVNYPNIIAYTSKAISIELPLTPRNTDVTDITPYANLAAGIYADNSKDGSLSASTAMLGFSYALPLNGDNTYFAAGFQANYSFNRIGQGTFGYFPEWFDEHGAVGAATRLDPYQSGYSFGYFTAGAGAAVFHNGESNQWYAGGSIRHFNHPYTEWNRSFRLESNNGIQAGYTTAVSNTSAIGGYTNLSWQAGDHEYFFGAFYTRNLDDSADYKITGGIGYRSGDALFPNLALTFKRSRFSFYYEVNLPGTTYSGYKRRAFAFCYRLLL